MSSSILARNHVIVTGRGTTPMLFAHGFGCDQNMWRFVAPAFADDHRLVTFDYVGSGRSDLAAYDVARYSSLDGYARDVLDVIHALDLRDIVFVGHSVSSMVGVLAAIREPDRFARLVMVGPSPRYMNDAGTSEVSTVPTSRGCSTRWIATMSAGPPSWLRPSWRTATAHTSPSSCRRASAPPIRSSRVASPK